MIKKKLIIFPFILFASILLTFFYLLIIERNPSELPSNLLNKKVPIFQAESLLKDKKFISSEIFEGEIILVNFFATWCKPCEKEHRFIKKFANEKKIKVIGINYKDNYKKTENWLNDLGNPYSDIAIDKNGRIAIDWGVYGIPETFLINSDGIIKYRQVGEITKKTYIKISKIIETIN